MTAQIKNFLILRPWQYAYNSKEEEERAFFNVRVFHAHGKKPPPGQCNTENDSDCCKEGEPYPTYECSPLVTTYTKAKLTLDSFEKHGDGGGRSDTTQTSLEWLHSPPDGSTTRKGATTTL
ncbi:hypothetical protein PIB30_014561 [Stylosanthes scabra]|uniref:Uncharacterized protein n=1 Tax=Stylosanthes scabra TaxID=79078 RepID=A0ABU6Z8G9_9FABA|nr:hypothetical protein [Stylosanthes scabra]